LLPGSEIAGEAAAALSAAALMYRRLGVKRNTGSYITHAKQLYNLAVGAQGSYADANPRSCLGIHKVWLAGEFASQASVVQASCTLHVLLA
jgi:hypothetical protein